MKAADLHRNSLLHQIKKLEDGKFTIGNKNVIMRSDSKGRAFLRFLSYRNRIDLVYRSGATITNPFLQQNTLNKIRNTINPIVVLFFGTCELTSKIGRYICVPEDLESRITQVKENYLDYKTQILQANQIAKVIFLDCPYQSIVIWNFLHNHPSPGCFETDQKRLEEAIKSLNLIIREINGDQVVPRLSRDLVYSTKKKRKAPIYYRNYSLLKDGVHSGDLITKLWFLRITRMITLA